MRSKQVSPASLPPLRHSLVAGLRLEVIGEKATSDYLHYGHSFGPVLVFGFAPPAGWGFVLLGRGW